jgi:hypothetical protein
MVELKHKPHMPIPKPRLFLLRKLEDIPSMKPNEASVGSLQSANERQQRAFAGP